MAIAIIITDTLSAVATIANFMINDENAPFCFAKYLLAMKNDRFIPDIEWVKSTWQDKQILSIGNYAPSLSYM